MTPSLYCEQRNDFEMPLLKKGRIISTGSEFHCAVVTDITAGTKRTKIFSQNDCDMFQFLRHFLEDRDYIKDIYKHVIEQTMLASIKDLQNCSTTLSIYTAIAYDI